MEKPPKDNGTNQHDLVPYARKMGMLVMGQMVANGIDSSVTTETKPKF